MDVVWSGGTTESATESKQPTNRLPTRLHPTQHQDQHGKSVHSTSHTKAAGRATTHMSIRNRIREHKQSNGRNNAEATAYQATSNPKARGASTGTGASHTQHTHTHNAGESGQAGRASLGISRRPVYSAAEGHGPGIAGSSKVKCGMAGKARQWQHAGNNVGKRGMLWACCAVDSQPQSRSRATCSYIARCSRDALSVSPSFLTWFLSSHSEGCARPKMSVAVLVCTPH